ncbi:MAG TPA: MFS transporter [Chloroflexota bacterium]|nr:MFS transporter [Chloroflexota bacterium]
MALSIFWLSLNFQSGAFYAIVLPAQILLFVSGGAGATNQALFLGLSGIIGAVVAIIVQPVAGALSDQSESTLGRRRPYILVGALGLLGGTLALAWSYSAVSFLLGFLLVQVGGAVSTGAYQGLLPDRVPPEQRGAASGYLGLMTILGTLGSLAAAGLLLGNVTARSGHGTIETGVRTFYLLTIVVVGAGAGITIAGVPEARPRVGAKYGAIWRPHLWMRPWSYSNFRWVFLTRVAIITGLAVFMTYIEYYFARVAHVSHFVRLTALVAFLSLGGAVASALLGGILSDRLDRVKLVFVASLCMAAAALCFSVWPGEPPLIPLGLLFGAGFGAYVSVDWALAVDVLPSLRQAGKDMGLWSIASTLPAFLAPALGSAVIAVSALAGLGTAGYRAVFGLAVLLFTLGAVGILRVRVERRSE